MKVFLFLFVTIAGCAFLVDDDCEDKWVASESRSYKGYAIGGDCYYISRVVETWFEAKRICEEGIGGNLLSIHDMVQNDLAVSLSEKYMGGNDQWIGLNDIEKEDSWEWTDGTKLFFSNWNEGEPNNSGGEDCVELRTSSGKWNDYDCNLAIYFSCRVEGEGYTYFFENDNFDQSGTGGELEGLYGVAEETHCCEYMEECGFQENSISSLFVPRDSVLVLYDEKRCESNSEYPYTLVQGPVNIPRLGRMYGDISSYRLEKYTLADYPLAFVDENFENFAFYITGYCGNVDVCFDYRSLYNDVISSLIIPAGWTVVFYEDVDFGGMKLAINGPRNIASLQEYHSFFDNAISSFKLMPASSAALVIEEILFDEAEQIGDLEYDVLESVTIKNPTNNAQEYSMSSTYSQTQETNWFSEKSVTKSYNYEIGVTSEVSGGGILGEASAGVSFTASWGGESSSSSGEGGSHSYTEEKSYEFVCSANANTRTTCDITQTHATYNIPYKGKIIFEYDDGKKGERDWEGMISTVVRGESFLQFEEEDLLCPSGNEKNGYCYDVIDGDTYSFTDAMAECYFKGKTVAHPRDQSENQYIHELCDYRSIWFNGYVENDGFPSWEDSDYTRYDATIDGTKFGNDQYYIFVPQDEDDLGYWVVKDKEQRIADCVVCMWECDRDE